MFERLVSWLRPVASVAGIGWRLKTVAAGLAAAGLAVLAGVLAIKKSRAEREAWDARVRESRLKAEHERREREREAAAAARLHEMLEEQQAAIARKAERDAAAAAVRLRASADAAAIAADRRPVLEQLDDAALADRAARWSAKR